MQAPGSLLSPEQESMLGTVFHFLESSMIYFRAVLPVVREADEHLLKGLLELGEICLRRLPEYFPELQPLAEGIKSQGTRA